MRVLRSILLLVMICVLGLNLFACKSSPDEPESPLALDSPQKAPEASPVIQEPTPLELPATSPGLGIVRGQLVSVSPEASVLLAGDIYLASLIYTEGELQIPFVRLDPTNDPKATLRNEANDFAILDVAPGEYGIVIHTPVNDYVVPDGQGGFLTIEVEENKVLDLGVIELR